MGDSTDSRKCILEVAAKLFAKFGLDKCSTREIAKESNSNISLISYYFGGKEGLYKEVMRQAALEMKEHVETVTQSVRNKPITKDLFIREIEISIESLIYFRMKYPEVCMIFAREKLMGLEHSQEIYKEIFYPLTQNFIRLVEEAQKNLIMKSDIDPALFFVLLSEGIWGFFEIKACPIPLAADFERVSKDIKKLVNQISDIYLKGVLL